MINQGTIRFLFLLSINISFNTTISQPIHFTNETIEIKIYDGYAIINGSYIFVGNNKVTTLFYPFPVNQYYAYPDSIFVTDLNNKEIRYTKSSSGIYFSISTLPDSETVIKVSYKQRLTSDEMKYILITTQQWKHPLRKAEYIISLPAEFELQNISIAPDRSDSDSTHNIYYITKENFMPDTDLIVTWARRKE
jgi:hypothetical protein